MASPIGLQLYSLRQELNEDFEGVVRKVAETGYVGVEPYGGMPVPAEDAAKLFNELGLECQSAHLPIALGDNREKTMADAAAYGIKYLFVPYIGPENFTTLDGIKNVADQLNEAHELAKAAGMAFGYHNHDFEFVMVEGKPAYLHLQELVDPSILMEIDTYWVQVGGYDPVKLTADLGSRAPVLHIKDGPADSKQADMTAVGDGKMPVADIIAAGGSNTEWLIVELDRCATDMMEAVQKSYRYMIEKGLARGNKD
jgi:sugar phosphate isomerase/epimerase